MYRHLLLPTDGSELSVRAFTAGIALAKTLGARVTGSRRRARAPGGDGIVKTATERGCDLICMGSQGRRGLAGLLLGSDTVDVLNNCTIPLLVYR